METVIFVIIIAEFSMAGEVSEFDLSKKTFIMGQ